MKIALLVFLAHFLLSCSSTKVGEIVPPKKESRIVALKEAYLYGYPLVTMEMARRVLTNVKKPTSEGLAPLNQFSHRSIIPDPQIKELLNPNLDVLYSSAFLDLSQGPLILTVPPPQERYYMIQVMNGWTDIISSIGTRMDLDRERSYFIHGPQWRGIPPKHMKVIASSTNLNWILGRTYVKDKTDLKKATAFMNQYRLRPIRNSGIDRIHPEYLNKTPDSLVEKMTGEEFFNLLNTVMLKNFPYREDRPQLEKLAKIGVGSGLVFNVDNFTPEEQRFLSELPQTVSLELTRAEKNDALLNGWDMNLDPRMGRFGTHYEFRARIALTRLGMPLMEDAVFPEAKIDGDNEPLSGQHKYILHFNKGQDPPSRALWSLTAYGANQQLSGNAFNQYKIDNKMELLYNGDGSLDIYIQNEAPAGNRKKNWLPTPRGLFTIQSRIYWPESRMLNGQWAMPVILKNKEVTLPSTAESEIRFAP